MPRSTARLAPLALVPLVLVLAACGGGTPTAAGPAAADTSALDEMSIEELTELAEEEGEVVVYSFTSRIASVEGAFEEQYPGIDLVATDLSATEQISRLTAESQAGSSTADVAYISDAPVVFTELVESGILTPYVPERVRESLPEEYTTPLVANRLSTKVLMYNEEANPDGPPVTNLWELTEPEWQGRVIMVDPTVRGDYLDLMTEMSLRADEMADAHESLFGTEIELDAGIADAGQQWIADLYANDVILVDDTDTVNASIGATGQTDPPVGFTSYSDRRDNDDEGWALQVATDVEPAPGIVFPALLGITAEAENPAAARLFIDFLMGDDSPTGGTAYEPFYVGGDYPTRTDMEAPSDAVSLDELGGWIIEPERTAAARDAISDLLLTIE
ncbi:ABC transporter substrate-binding protein [Marisediminicola sp. LYQ134]|uniref:ABC transporter substrate-binding protein n=1 Tax=unclassified Marisediminicola TaxID=2618316 RepID=UPI0039838985